MYFLRRRHGRKSNSDTRRDTPPPASPPAQFMEPEPVYAAELEEPVAPKPVVIKKAKRPRIESTAEEDCKPAGTFRSGTLHLARASRSEPTHGKA
jgi:hypothetical protein